MTGKAAFQSDFKFKIGETHYFFTYVQLTFMLHYRIHDFLFTELSLRKAGSSELQFNFRELKTQHLANIWKVALAPFATL